MVDINVLKDIVPKNQKSMITQDLVDKVNEWDKDPLLVDSYRENVYGYIGVLKEGKYKIEDYMNAVRFVSYKLLGHSDIDAYAITFPERYKRLIDEGLKRPQMSPYSVAYKKNKLVNAVFEQTIVPSHVLNAPMYQDALNELAHIMVHGKSEMARVTAAGHILTNTKAPEVTKIQLDIGVNNSDAIGELRKATEELAIEQERSIKAGLSVKYIAESKIIDVEVEDE